MNIATFILLQRPVDNQSFYFLHNLAVSVRISMTYCNRHVPYPWFQFSGRKVWLLLVLTTLLTGGHARASRLASHLSPRVIRTKYGTLRGWINNIGVDNLGDAEVFLGVPYAEPPVGNLRFMPPGTPSPWRNVRVAQHLGPVCPQRLPDIRNMTEALKTMSMGRYLHLRRLIPYLRNQSEDCLYLNIYSPAAGL